MLLPLAISQEYYVAPDVPTAAQLDAADGVLDGKYFGKDIYTEEVCASLILCMMYSWLVWEGATSFFLFLESPLTPVVFGPSLDSADIFDTSVRAGI